LGVYSLWVYVFMVRTNLTAASYLTIISKLRYSTYSTVQYIGQAGWNVLHSLLPRDRSSGSLRAYQFVDEVSCFGHPAKHFFIFHICL